MSRRFLTHWADDNASRIDGLEEQAGILETENAVLRELIEEGKDLLKEADFEDAGTYYDTQHWLAEVDLLLEQPPT